MPHRPMTTLGTAASISISVPIGPRIDAQCVDGLGLHVRPTAESGVAAQEQRHGWINFRGLYFGSLIAPQPSLTAVHDWIVEQFSARRLRSLFLRWLGR